MAGDYFMYPLTQGTTSNNYTITYYPQPRHPGCPGRKHTCPDCGQEYFAPTPVQPIWVVPQPNWPTWQPNIVYCSATGVGSTTTNYSLLSQGQSIS